MSEITAEITQHYGHNAGTFPAVASVEADISLHLGHGAGHYDSDAYLSGDATIESWPFGSTFDADNDVEAGFDPDRDREGERPVKIETVYVVHCYRGGHVAWRERFTNLVTTAGLTQLVDSTFVRGDAAPAWFIGLIEGGEGDFEADDTMTSHAGWVEEDAYSEETRPAFVPGAAAGGATDNGASRAVFHINETDTIAGFFLVNDDEKLGTGGILYGEGTFGGGVRQVEDGDILRVAATIQLS